MRPQRAGYFFIVMAGILFGVMTTFAENGQVHLFMDGVRHYEEKAYPEAIGAFEAAMASGIRNGKLFYNLGNAHLKNGNLGHAILWYERAQALMPNDPDLVFNLTYANSLLKDEREDTASPVSHVLFFWKDMFQISTLQWAVMVLNGAFWLCFGLYRYFRTGILRQICWGLLFFLVFSLGTIGWRMYEVAFSPEAVILEPSVAVRSGYALESTELFVLHAGTKVSVEKQVTGFLKIRFSKDKIGWIPDRVAGII